MKYGKRQLILASLVLALGAAVYLNWQFAGSGVKTEGDVSSEPSSALGAAQLVNNSYVETVSDDLESTGDTLPEFETTPVDGEASGTEAAAPAAEKLSDARMTRQTARDEAVELLEDILADAEADTAVKEAAVSEASAIAQNILKETNIESLVEAKGFAECVAYINGDTCTIVVNGDMEDAQNALIVRDIAVSETGLSAEKIKLISAS
ncbi:SpoIIIAH-like family protein [Anaeromassilibacillus senegalensis]|uniref:SpoIIIAH-like family protein n=1 Tax=Anaeromassilibacillus senegalensis TaxID=1673717 RepID=A0ABS9CKL9_9FIRM|nr:SpoIIIAH-like family protein [Anaeromassilibacillus senegalensis]MCF2651684.1 SpoIIIAH-like family protein [Anaeromassilibacillus senegalensis]MCI5651990.1 SpoIIIAH-like family protein [Ruminococcus bromii]MDD7647619.1 SpoIIIAH-like family protein [Ruminococcus bromii]